MTTLLRLLANAAPFALDHRPHLLVRDASHSGDRPETCAGVVRDEDRSRKFLLGRLERTGRLLEGAKRVRLTLRAAAHSVKNIDSCERGAL